MIALTLTLALGATSPAPCTHSPSSAEAEQIFDEVMRETGSPQLRAARLTSRAHLDLDGWLTLAASESLSWSIAPGATLSRPIGPEESLVIASGLSLFPAEALESRLLERARTDWSLDARLRAVSRATAGLDLGLLCTVAAAGGEGRLSRAARQAVEAAASAMIERTAPHGEECARGLAEVPRTLLAPVLSALAAGSPAEALPRAIACVGARPVADGHLLTLITRQCRACAMRPEGLDTAPLRRALAAADGAQRLEAARALAALDDTAAVPDLIAGLGAHDSATYHVFRKALEALSGERQMVRAEEWRLWHDRELAWKRDRLPALRTTLGSGTPGQVRRALLECARHRLFRAELVPLAERAAKSDDHETVRVAASTLGHFATVTSVGALIELLGHPADDVRRESYYGLRRATGLDHGDDAEAWSKALDGVLERALDRAPDRG